MIQAAYPKMDPPKTVLQSCISEHEILVIAYSKQWSPEIKNCWSQLCQNLLFVFLAHGVYWKLLIEEREKWFGGQMENNKTFLGTKSSLAELY